MKILIFIHGTILVHKNASGKASEGRVHQVINNDLSIHGFMPCVPVGILMEDLVYGRVKGQKLFIRVQTRHLNFSVAF